MSADITHNLGEIPPVNLIIGVIAWAEIGPLIDDWKNLFLFAFTNGGPFPFCCGQLEKRYNLIGWVSVDF